LTGNAFAPARFRARATTTWDWGHYSAALTDNFTGPERDPYEIGSPHVKSWTTVDLQIAIHSAISRGLLSGVRIALNMQNLFNVNPPYITFTGFGIPEHYDSTNASPLGRFASLKLTKAWY
jgi:iron complex outermembrane receptor protein